MEKMETVLFTIACISTLLFLIKLGMFMFAGMDSEIDADFSSMEDSDASFNFLSVQSLLAFFMGFGWSGVAAMRQFGLSIGVSFGVAVGTGLFFMFVSALLFRLTKKLNKTVKINLKELEGKPAKTYTAFAPKGKGQIEVTLNKKLTIFDATNNTDCQIASFTTVKVQKVQDDIIYITLN
jgi:hypothetical protein